MSSTTNPSSGTSANGRPKVKSKKKTKAKPAAPKFGPAALTGTTAAKRVAAGILDILAGLRTTTEGATALGISLPRYYVLETRVVQAIINACEPQPRGRKRTPQKEIEDLERLNTSLRHEVSRMQAIVRAAHRSIGLPSTPPSPKAKVGAKPKRKRKKTPRAKRMVAALRQPAVEETTSPGNKKGNLTQVAPGSGRYPSTSQHPAD